MEVEELGFARFSIARESSSRTVRLLGPIPSFDRSTQPTECWICQSSRSGWGTCLYIGLEASWEVTDNGYYLGLR